jgi:hypothetical protein
VENRPFHTKSVLDCLQCLDRARTLGARSERAMSQSHPARRGEPLRSHEIGLWTAALRHRRRRGIRRLPIALLSLGVLTGTNFPAMPSSQVKAPPSGAPAAHSSVAAAGSDCPGDLEFLVHYPRPYVPNSVIRTISPVTQFANEARLSVADSQVAIDVYSPCNPTSSRR